MRTPHIFSINLLDQEWTTNKHQNRKAKRVLSPQNASSTAEGESMSAVSSSTNSRNPSLVGNNTGNNQAYRLKLTDLPMVKTPRNKNFACPKCDFRADGIGVLKQHLLAHSGDTVFECEFCTFTAGNKKLLSRHYKVHKPQTDTRHSYNCDKCGYVTDNKHHLASHSAVHAVTKVHKCSQCDFTSKYAHSVKRHEKSHKGDNIIHCSLCSYRSSSNKIMSQHYKHCHKQLCTYQCPDCSFVAKTLSMLKTHSLVHKRLYKCTECEFKCKLKSDLKRHCTAVHKHHKRKPDECATPIQRKLHQCTKCEFKCQRRAEMTKHCETLHKCASKKPYQCAKCTFSTKYKQNLTRHKKLCTIIRQCKRCPFTTTSAIRFSGHSIRHRNDIYKCKWCDFTFMYKTELRAHQKSHQKLHQCSICRYRATGPEELKEHGLGHEELLSRYKCDKCAYVTCSRSLFRDHTSAKHPKTVKAFQCSECKFSSASLRGLKTHQKRHHTFGAVHQCSSSSFNASTAVELNHHNETTNVATTTTYKCSQSDYSSFSARGLSTHTGHKHSSKGNVDRQKCEHCDFKTGTVKSLELHMKTHYCPHCNYFNGQAWVLEHHIRTHSSTRAKELLQCPHCDYKTTYSLALKVHMCTHTGEESPI